MVFRFQKLIVFGLGMVLVTVLFASPAGAECAWILWIKQEISMIYPNNPPTVSTEWKLQKAVLTLQDCEQVKKIMWNFEVKRITDGKSPGLESVRTVPNEMIFRTLKPSTELIGGWDTQTFVCVPDTIDPRRSIK